MLFKEKKKNKKTKALTHCILLLLLFCTVVKQVSLWLLLFFSLVISLPVLKDMTVMAILLHYTELPGVYLWFFS